MTYTGRISLIWVLNKLFILLTGWQGTRFEKDHGPHPYPIQTRLRQKLSGLGRLPPFLPPAPSNGNPIPCTHTTQSIPQKNLALFAHVRGESLPHTPSNKGPRKAACRPLNSCTLAWLSAITASFFASSAAIFSR